MAKIIIDGREYESPDLSEVDLGQAQIIERYTGRSLNELGTGDATSATVIAAFCHLALRGEDPTKSFEAIRREVDVIKLAKLDFRDEAEPEAEEDLPPVSAPTGREKSDSEPEPSGSSSSNGSDDSPASVPPSIGAPVSATSSPYVQET
jgi:hypothetical protein